MLGETFGDCRPWDTGLLTDNTNLLNNFKCNLNSYQKVYKKYSGTTAARRHPLPQIRTQHQTKISLHCKNRPQRTQTKTIDFKEEVPTQWNKSLQLQTSKSDLRVCRTKQTHKRGLTALDQLDQLEKENVQETQRQRQMSKLSYKSKVYLINFGEQEKDRRVKKRDLHLKVFGEKKRYKYLLMEELR